MATPLLTLFVGAGIGAMAYFLKALHRDIRDKFQNAEAKIGRAERELLEFKAQFPKHYVMKDDYIRTITGFEFKLDDLSKKIDTLIRRDDGQT